MIEREHRAGFTLIELSIVLVIIGLIVGGVLVGRDLIEAATIRATITQLEKYQAAVETFRTKYNGLPGDLRASDAAAVGFFARSGGPGDGDGNGKIEGIGAPGNAVPLGGETVFFWTDLSAAGLIDGSFTQSTDAAINTLCCLGNIATPYLPIAKTGHNGYVMAFENFSAANFGAPGYSGLIFEIGQIANTTGGGNIMGYVGITVLEAQSIDTKIDDGLPLSGRVLSAGPGQNNAVQSIEVYNTLLGTTKDYCASNATTPATYNNAFPDNVNCDLMIKAGL